MSLLDNQADAAVTDELLINAKIMKFAELKIGAEHVEKIEQTPHAPRTQDYSRMGLFTSVPSCVREQIWHLLFTALIRPTFLLFPDEVFMAPRRRGSFAALQDCSFTSAQTWLNLTAACPALAAEVAAIFFQVTTPIIEVQWDSVCMSYGSKQQRLSLNKLPLTRFQSIELHLRGSGCQEKGVETVAMIFSTNAGKWTVEVVENAERPSKSRQRRVSAAIVEVARECLASHAPQLTKSSSYLAFFQDIHEEWSHQENKRIKPRGTWHHAIEMDYGKRRR